MSSIGPENEKSGISLKTAIPDTRNTVDQKWSGLLQGDAKEDQWKALCEEISSLRAESEVAKIRYDDLKAHSVRTLADEYGRYARLKTRINEAVSGVQDGKWKEAVSQVRQILLEESSK